MENVDNSGILYIVATPIGNLEDITLRAIRILKEVDLILCEDTRTSSKLLRKYDINTKTMSYHTHSAKGRESSILKMLKEGKNLALISDAGTPTISDPGVLLVSNVRADLPEVKVVPIPGPSALISALSASGVSASDFTFFGFLPHKKGRQTIFNEIIHSKRVSVFYESTHRIMKTFETLDELDGEVSIIVARELTKQFEEFARGAPRELLEYFHSNKEKQKGEFVVIVVPK